MALEQFSIEIIDTHTNSMPLVDELTAFGSPKLIYNGSDDAFTNILASELHFTMEVNDGTDGKFLHLYTSDEFRYKVVVYDTTVQASPVVFWQGFLLPEQFKEPYTSTTFYVDFIATDGIGILKGQYLPDAYYSDRKGIVAIVRECLLLTGLSLPFKVAVAMVNEVIETIRTDQIELDTVCYTDSGKRKDAYEILKAIITSMGFRLFLYAGSWYVIGLNRFKDGTIVTEEYDASGAYTGTGSILRTERIAKFLENPFISIVPRFKWVEIDWEIAQRSNVLLEDIVYQKPSGDEGSIYTYALKYWNKVYTTSWIASITTLNMYDVPSYELDAGDVIQLYSPDSVLPTPNTKKFAEPFYLYFEEYIASGQLTTDYIELEDFVYVEGGYTSGRNMKLEIAFKSWTDSATSVSTIQTNFDASAYVAVYFYAIELNGKVICSNLSSFSNSAIYDYELSLQTVTEGTYIAGSLTIDTVPILEDGFINVKIYPPVGTDAALHLHKTVYEKFSLTYNQAVTNTTITKTRDIVNTNTKTVSVFHGDILSDLTTRKFLINESVPFAGITINYPAFEQQLSATNYTHITDPGLPDYNEWYYTITDAEYSICRDNMNNLYKYNTTDGFVNIPVFSLSDPADTTRKIIIMNQDSLYLTTSDDLYIKFAAYSETFDDLVYVQNKWRRYENTTEQIRYRDGLCMIYHNLVESARYMVEGRLFGLHLPLDRLFFDFVASDTYLMGRLTLDLTEGMTDVVMIADGYDEVTDYVS